MAKFTRDELMVLWKSAVDSGYSQPLVTNPDSGIEIIEQAAEQLAVVSDAVETNSQAMYIMPHSAQTAPPAAGAQRASVTLDLTRAGSAMREITLVRGTFVEEIGTDFGPDGGIEVETGRQYALTSQVTLAPGVAAISFDALAELSGYGYNLPLPGSISRIVQPAAHLTNTLATLIPGVPSHNLVMAPPADVLTPENIGQYILLNGANLGQVRRMIGYLPAPFDQSNGGTAVLAATGVVRISMVSGVFIPGETITQAVTLGTGTLDVATADVIVYERTTPNDLLVSANTITGAQSGAVANVLQIYQAPGLIADTGVEWRVADWVLDLGLSVTNPASPSGGKSPMLDARGFDRSVFRSSGESDDSYRNRVHQLPDVVSPNAIKRAANRVLAPHGAGVCFREVGEIDKLFPGMFYDVLSTDPKYAFAYDLDLVTFNASLPATFIEGERATQIRSDGVHVSGIVVTAWIFATPTREGLARVNGVFEAGRPIVGDVSGATFTPTIIGPGLDPSNRFKLDMDFLEMRAFFLIGVPPLSLGEFGIAYDTTSQINFYDAAPYLSFFDGYSVQSATINRRVWDAVDKARMGGVSFDLYVENLGCF
jgi:hypothetical protein